MQPKRFLLSAFPQISVLFSKLKFRIAATATTTTTSSFAGVNEKAFLAKSHNKMVISLNQIFPSLCSLPFCELFLHASHRAFPRAASNKKNARDGWIYVISFCCRVRSAAVGLEEALPFIFKLSKLLPYRRADGKLCR